MYSFSAGRQLEAQLSANLSEDEPFRFESDVRVAALQNGTVRKETRLVVALFNRFLLANASRLNASLEISSLRQFVSRNLLF